MLQQKLKEAHHKEKELTAEVTRCHDKIKAMQV